jgi:hypothetical protein
MACSVERDALGERRSSSNTVEGIDVANSLGDVPAPQLVGSAGQELRSRVVGMPELVPALPYLVVGCQEAVHRPLGAEVSAFIEEGRADLRWGELHEPRLVELVEHRVAERHAVGRET